MQPHLYAATLACAGLIATATDAAHAQQYHAAVSFGSADADTGAVSDDAPVHRRRGAGGAYGQGHAYGFAETSANSLRAGGTATSGALLDVQRVYSFGHLTLDDVRFESITDGPAPVWLALRLEGQHSKGSTERVEIVVELDGQQAVGAWQEYETGFEIGKGLLIGYDGRTPFEFVAGPFEVPTNTDLELDLHLEVVADAAAGQPDSYVVQELSFSSELLDTPPIVLPPGVAAISAQGMIFGDDVQADGALYGMIDDATPAEGGTCEVLAWNTEAGRPAMILLVAIDGQPVPPTAVLTGFTDGEGVFASGPIAHEPALAGMELELRACALPASGRWEVSDPFLVTMQ